MLHPSYTDLIEAVNSDVEPGEQPVVQSRYSIVIAASKRARQLIAGDEPLVAGAAGKKPLSTAVQELYEQKVKILTEDEEPEIETDFEVKDRTPEEIKKEEEYAEEYTGSRLWSGFQSGHGRKYERKGGKRLNRA